MEKKGIGLLNKKEKKTDMKKKKKTQREIEKKSKQTINNEREINKGLKKY